MTGAAPCGVLSSDLRGNVSPRTRKWVGNLFPVLESYGYSWAEVVELIKNCDYDGNRIQEEVGRIMDIKSGHEQGGWELVGAKSSKSSAREPQRDSGSRKTAKLKVGSSGASAGTLGALAKQKKALGGRRNFLKASGEAGAPLDDSSQLAVSSLEALGEPASLGPLERPKRLSGGLDIAPGAVNGVAVAAVGAAADLNSSSVGGAASGFGGGALDDSLVLGANLPEQQLPTNTCAPNNVPKKGGGRGNAPAAPESSSAPATALVCATSRSAVPPGSTTFPGGNPTLQNPSKIATKTELQNQLLKSSKRQVSIDLIAKEVAVEKLLKGSAAVPKNGNSAPHSTKSAPAVAGTTRAGGRGNFTSWAALLKRNKLAQEAPHFIKRNSAGGSGANSGAGGRGAKVAPGGDPAGYVASAGSEKAGGGAAGARGRPGPRRDERRLGDKKSDKGAREVGEVSSLVAENLRLGAAASSAVPGAVEGVAKGARETFGEGSAKGPGRQESQTLEQPQGHVQQRQGSTPPAGLGQKPPVTLPRPLNSTFNPNLVFGCFEDDISLKAGGALPRHLAPTLPGGPPGTNWDPAVGTGSQNFGGNIAVNKYGGGSVPPLQKNAVASAPQISASAATTATATATTLASASASASHFYKLASGANSSYGLSRCNPGGAAGVPAGVVGAMGGVGLGGRQGQGQGQVLGASFSSAFCGNSFGNFSLGGFNPAANPVTAGRFSQEKFKYPSGANHGIVAHYQHHQHQHQQHNQHQQLKELNHEAALAASAMPLIYGHSGTSNNCASVGVGVGVGVGSVGSVGNGSVANNNNNNNNNTASVGGERYQDPPGLLGYYPPGHPFYHPAGASLYPCDLNANVAGPLPENHLNCGIDPSTWRP